MPEESVPSKGFERHAVTVTLLTAVSRAGGLIREAVFGRLVGLTDAASAFGFAFLVPNLFRRLFGEGALSAALIPELAKIETEHPGAAQRLAAITLARVTALLAVVVVIAEIVLLLIPVVGNGLHPGLRLLTITLPYMPLVCLAALAGAVLQVRGRFGPAAAMPIVLNASLVVAVFLAWVLGEGPVGMHRIWIVAGGVVVAGIIQAGWAVVMVRRTQPAGAVMPQDHELAKRSFRRVLVQALPMVFGLGVLQLNTFLDGLIASWPTVVGHTILGHPYPLDETAMATLGYASRLYEFPLGVFGIAVATAIFPQLSREAGETDVFMATLRRGLRLAFFIGLPASVGIALIREPFAAVVYQGLAFNAQDAQKVAVVLLAYSVAIWSYSLNQVLVRAFYARQEPMTPVRVGMVVVVLNLGLNLALVFGTSLGVAGLAWSTATCAIVQTAALGVILARRTGPIFSREFGSSIVRTLGASAAMGVLVSLVAAALPLWDSWAGQLGRLAILVACGVVSYVAITALMGMHELRWSLGRAVGRR